MCDSAKIARLSGGCIKAISMEAFPFRCSPAFNLSRRFETSPSDATSNIHSALLQRIHGEALLSLLFQYARPRMADP